MIKKIISVMLVMTLFGCAYREDPPAPIVDGIAQFAAVGNTSSKPITTAAKTVTATDDSDTASAAPTKITKLSRMNNSSSAASETTSPPKAIKAVASKPVVAEDDKDDTTKSSAGSGTARDGWMMPLKGDVVGKFSQVKKGIDIKAAVNSPIYAASDGKVVYSGNGLKGYGNLIIIRHDDGYLTAYAQNKTNLVKVGQDVKCGDKIAQVGDGGILHFELRKNGKPINPTDYISGK